jgi:cytochrome c556
MRALVMLGVGLAMGALLTLVAVNSLRKGTAYPNGVMTVMAAQMGQLDRGIKAGACAADDLAGNLATLQALGNDLEAAFLPTMDDARFSRLAGDYRAAVGRAATGSPRDCEDAGTRLNAISATCKACHQQFKG